MPLPYSDRPLSPPPPSRPRGARTAPRGRAPLTFAAGGGERRPQGSLPTPLRRRHSPGAADREPPPPLRAPRRRRGRARPPWRGLRGRDTLTGPGLRLSRNELLLRAGFTPPLSPPSRVHFNRPRGSTVTPQPDQLVPPVPSPPSLAALRPARPTPPRPARGLPFRGPQPSGLTRDCL